MKHIIFSLCLLMFSLFCYGQNETPTREEVEELLNSLPPETRASIDSLILTMDFLSPAQQIKEICSVKFGMTKIEAEKILNRKFGSPMYHPNEMMLIYENVKYGGLDFEKIIFMFQSDGIKDYFNSCIFVKSAKNAKEANLILDEYRKVLSKRYELDETLDDLGFKICWGGISPLWDGSLSSLVANDYSTAVHTDVIEYGEEIQKVFGDKYGVRLIYGPYNYVTEEF